MASVNQSKRSDKKQWIVEVRRGIFFKLRILLYFFIPKSGRKYSHTDSYIIHAPLSPFYLFNKYTADREEN